jgi:kumamolisin
MGKHTRWAPVAGSEPRHPSGAVALKRSRRPAEVRITLALGQAGSAIEERIAGLSAQLPARRQLPSRLELERLGGAAGRDLARIEELACQAGLRLVEVDRMCGMVLLAGTPAALERAFRVKLTGYRHERGTYLSHAGPVHVPAELAGVIEAVVGLDARPIVRRHSIGPRLGGAAGVSPAEIAEVYEFPEDATGRGQSITLIELGGGFYAADMREYFRRLGLRAAALTVRQVEGARNSPAARAEVRRFWDSLPEKNSAGEPPSAGGLRGEQVERVGWTIESTMDIQLAAALAPGARIAVYFAPPTAHGKLQAIRMALRERGRRPGVLSMSWGADEDGFDGSTVAVIERLLRLAALCGVTVCCSSGDDGAGAGGVARVNYPASSPHALACGGTHLARSGGRARESVWKEEFAGRAMASTGGASRLFPRPEWQASAQVSQKAGGEGRGVPDVAAKADVAQGYGILVAGLDIAMGGTSAAAPLWAALLARLNEKLGVSAGYVTPLFYQKRFRRAFRDITAGDSGPRFHASRGWDPCTGWGSPRGVPLLEALRDS